MNLFEDFNDWEVKLGPILRKYKGKKHPLNYDNIYQLLVVVLLSAQDSDGNINNIVPVFFENYPNFETLASSNANTLMAYLLDVKNSSSKVNWLLEIAKTVKKDEEIPLTMEGLISLKGIGRKSSNVIMREMKLPAEGIIVDLHVIRVAPRIGLIPETKDGNKAEKWLMEIFPKSIWGEVGMAISFLGRETCRPIPKCSECQIKEVCKYYEKNNK